MCYRYQHRWLPALGVAAAFAGLVPSALCQTPEQAAPQTLALSSFQIPAQSTSQSPAASPSPIPAAAAQTQTVAAPAATSSASPEDMGDALMAQLRYQGAIEAYKKIPHRSAEIWNK